MLKTGTSQLLSYLDFKDPIAMELGILDQDEILKSSVVAIKNERSQVDCPGHFGHLELARPVYHAGLLEYIRKILKCVCFNCSRLLYPREKDHVDVVKRYKNVKQRFLYILRMCERYGHRQCDINTEGCGMKQPKFMKKGLGLEVEYSNDDHNFMDNLGYTSVEKKQPIWPEDVFRVFSKINQQDQDMLGIKKPQNMIIKRLNVAPPPIPGQPSQRHKSGKPLKALGQRLKGKEGRIRGNLMGKRVDFSARSVITPDPNLELDQLGVPLKIAQNLTIPVTVTPQNIDDLRQLTSNGPFRYPGAKYIIRHDGRQLDLSMLQNRCDLHLEPGYQVERHLLNNDLVLFNRQPSLHKMSIMGHRIKVLPNNTFRLNLSVTSPYNADFDGDEMNMFVPQSYESMAEVKEIMAVPLQIVSPQANKPVMGIVQDSLLGIMLFTRNDNFIDKQTAMMLMMWLGKCNEDKFLPIPAILKPKPLWTGKQILSLVIPNVNLKNFQLNKNKLPVKDNKVLILKGELLSGIMNKKTVGSQQQGLIHIIWREQGQIAAKDFLSNAQNVINQWLAQYGFSVGVQDCIASKQTMQDITEKLNHYKEKVMKIIQRAECGKLKFQPGKNMLESFEAKVNNTLNSARDEAGQLAIRDVGPQNRIQNMVDAGSKGTEINISQIMACVGQQNVEGKRIPFGFRARSLPHFTKFDYGAESKGFVKSNYLSGLTPTEFFFHAMGGREGLIDTAVKTSETGYIQRRLMKALEDVMVKYDQTLRNSSEQVIQFLYGEDSMAGEQIEDVKIDILKLSNDEIDQKFSFIPSKVTNSSIIREQLKKSMDDYSIDMILDNPQGHMTLMEEVKQIMRDRDELRQFIFKDGNNEIHVPVNIKRLILNCDQQFSLKKQRTTNLDPLYVVQQVKKLVDDLTVYPGMTKQQGYFSEANENSTRLFKIYLRSELSSKRLIQQEKMTQLGFDWLLGEIKSRFEQSLIHPGEMVGSIAAHSLGEPATQMTLNTFHFAGVSSKNVTLGVPRLKEVINVSKTIKTPMVQVYLKGKNKKSDSSVMKVQGEIEHTTLGHLIESSQIYYDPDPTMTIIKEDEKLVDLWNEVPDATFQRDSNCFSPWVLRMKLDYNKVLSRTLDMNQICKRLADVFQDQLQIMHSDINDENLVIRMRFKDLRDDPINDQNAQQTDQESAVNFLKEVEDAMLHELTLKGIPEISKVYAKKYQEQQYDPLTGIATVSNDNWMIETDGVALQKILSVKRVDHKRTISNDILEILQTLGIEAVRKTLINELRVVLGSYNIYVNYRHIATLCDVMCQKGRLTSITRHGINRLDTGPLRKCSFEETVEIMLEAAVFNEIDPLKGITESIMMGKTAPLGTGAFDIVLDKDVLQENAQTNLEEELVGEDTPMQEDEYYRGFGYMTDYIQNTPDPYRGGMVSEYGRTPGNQSQYGDAAGFSPGPNMQSPYYASPNPNQSPYSPNYRINSPVYNAANYTKSHQSPIYQGYASPIYQPGSDGLCSPNKLSPSGPSGGASGLTQSPTYSPHQSSVVNSPYQQSGSEHNKITYSPSYGTGQGARSSPISSPSLMGNSPASPSYSPQGVGLIGSHRSGTSPVYSPTMGGSGGLSHTSPAYSPTTPNYNSCAYQVKQQSYSPSYSPTSAHNNLSAHSPRYNLNRSPKYSVELTPGNSSIHSPKSGNTDELHDSTTSGHRSGSGAASTSSVSGMYIPSLPNPYSSNSPSYRGVSGLNSSGGGSSILSHEGGSNATGQNNTGARGGSSIYDPTATNNAIITQTKEEDHD